MRVKIQNYTAEDYPEHVYAKANNMSKTDSSAQLIAVELTQLQSNINIQQHIQLQQLQQLQQDVPNLPVVPTVAATAPALVVAATGEPTATSAAEEPTAPTATVPTDEVEKYNQLSSARLESLKMNRRKRKVVHYSFPHSAVRQKLFTHIY